MQDGKLINIGTAIRNGRTYSVEFHEDNHYAHVKRVNLDGTEDHFALGLSPDGPAHRYENFSDSGTTSYLGLDGVDTPVNFDKSGPFESREFSPKWISHDLWDSTNAKIDLTDVAEGSIIMIAYQVKITPHSSNETLRLFLRFGTFNNYEMTLFDGSMGASSKPHDYVGTKMFFVINSELRQNGVQLVANATTDYDIEPAFIAIALM